MRAVITIGFLLTGAVIFGHCDNLRNQLNFQDGEMWIAGVEHGNSSFHANPAAYRVYRNVMDFGCMADGVTDDTDCINTAISSGGRCGLGCVPGSSTVTPAVVYFPSGTYFVSGRIIMYYFTQLIGNAKNPPILKAAANFNGAAVIDANPYGPGGDNWYQNQNNFFRQVRNFVIDMTGTPSTATTTGIHWQVAQATSLFHITFLMSRALGSRHRGINMENGSGGFMSDLRFEGGQYGMNVGNQQFLSRNMQFDGCDVAIYISWNWQWTFKELDIQNCRVGIQMTSTSGSVQSGVGSVLVMDSNFRDLGNGILVLAATAPNRDDTSGTILLDNVKASNVPNLVVDTDGVVVLPGSAEGEVTIPSWGRGSIYTDRSGTNTFATDFLPIIQKNPSLLDSEGNFFSRSRPQYEELSPLDFVSVKSAGAMGDGVTDDADAIQSVIDANIGGKVVYFPAGSYVIGKTVNVHPGNRLIGEAWSVLMAGGDSTFQDEANPAPMLKIGEPGDSGMGAQPGAILIQWNMRESSQGSAAMWDSHFRVGGFSGSDLQVGKCPRGQSAVPECFGVHTLIQFTPQSSAYLENIWAWTSDHDLDLPGQISIYTGRGVVVESRTGPVWLYGTQSEHNVLSQYQLTGASNVFMTMIQSETPYWQAGPPAPAPYTPNPTFADPTYDWCEEGDLRCPMSYAIRSINSQNVYVYGAGMYNFFNNYDQTCLATEDCQSAMVDLTNNTNFVMFNANTKAAVNMIVENDVELLARSSDNTNGFCQTINAFLSQAVM